MATRSAPLRSCTRPTAVDRVAYGLSVIDTALLSSRERERDGERDRERDRERERERKRERETARQRVRERETERERQRERERERERVGEITHAEREGGAEAAGSVAPAACDRRVGGREEGQAESSLSQDEPRQGPAGDGGAKGRAMRELARMDG